METIELFSARMRHKPAWHQDINPAGTAGLYIAAGEDCASGKR